MAIYFYREIIMAYYGPVFLKGTINVGEVINKMGDYHEKIRRIVTKLRYCS
jgi:hypothetical protein